MIDKPSGALRRGWTTGACATAATKAALTSLITGDLSNSVSIILPKGEQPEFAVVQDRKWRQIFLLPAIIKDAGDDPDVTHGAEIIVTVRHGIPGSGVVFKAGSGVGYSDESRTCAGNRRTGNQSSSPANDVRCCLRNC